MYAMSEVEGYTNPVMAVTKITHLGHDLTIHELESRFEYIRLQQTQISEPGLTKQQLMIISEQRDESWRY